MTLRDYQTRDYAKIASALCASRRVLYVSPTGSGKTTLVAELIKGHIALGERVGFVAHRKELIDQCSNRLTQNGIAHGVIMAGHRGDIEAAVQVCSIQTLIRRDSPLFNLAIIDEAHHAPSDSYQKFAEKQPQTLGLTATPCRMDGRGLGNCFDTLVLGSSARELTSSGWLVTTRVFAPTRPDLGNVHSRAGDYVAAELQAAMDKPKITGSIVEHWLRLAAGRPTVVFASGVQHSLKIVEAFRAVGVKAAHLDADTPKEIREAILADLADKRLDVVSNCGILTEGWDCPQVSCVVLARPTKSLSLFLQMIGRSLRPAQGKANCLVLDHAGATLRHGFVTDDREWSLEPTRRVQAKDDSPSVRLCLRCYMAYESSLGPCPECGFAPPIKARKVNEAGGELEEITTVKPLSRNPMIAQLQKIQRERGYKPGWLWMQMQRIRRGQKPEIPNEGSSVKKPQIPRYGRTRRRRGLRKGSAAHVACRDARRHGIRDGRWAATSARENTYAPRHCQRAAGFSSRPPQRLHDRQSPRQPAASHAAGKHPKRRGPRRQPEWLSRRQRG